MIERGQPERLRQPSANFHLLLVSILAAVIGISAGFIAYVLYYLIQFFTNLFFYQRLSFQPITPDLNQLGIFVILVPVIGGLIVGLMARYGTPKIRGHGIPEAMEAVLTNRSRIAPRVAVLKPLSAAIAIGSGGPFGAEGPIIQTGGALGSLIGQIIHTTATERKVLLACGAAAGMAATFGTPIAGVILAIELLLFEFKSRSFIPLVIATTLADSVHGLLFDPGPMFTIGAVNFGMPQQLPFYIVLGLICGLAAVGFSKALYWVEDQFERLPVHWMWWPAIGAVGLGIIGFFVPRVLGVGYNTIVDILNDRLPLEMLLLILLFKPLALLISLGSGTSGGLLAPLFMSGAALGSIFALLVNKLLPGTSLIPGAFALVAMAAVFGAASRATFTFIIFAFELTHDYNAILPLMVACVIADGIAILLMHDTSIMTEKLVRRGLRVHQDYELDVMQQVIVSEVMVHDVPTISATMTVGDLANRIAQNDPTLTQHQALPILDANQQLVGLITRSDVLHAIGNGDQAKTVLEAGSDSLVVAYPDETLHEAITRMLYYNVGRLPVVSRDDPHHMIGYLGRSGVMQARLRRHADEHVRERGWIDRLSVFPKPH
ncbi:MAG TPA: chloride channel protein [Anaerolineae bacterium]|nr:chloride channel protein [Anaerolineae bacterium]